MARVRDVCGESDQITIDREADWSGSAVIHWVDANGPQQVALPGVVLRDIMETARVATILEVTNMVLDRTSDMLDEVARNIDTMAEEAAGPSEPSS